MDISRNPTNRTLQRGLMSAQTCGSIFQGGSFGALLCAAPVERSARRASWPELLDEKGTKYLVWSNSLYNRGPRQAQGTIMFRPPDNVAIGPPVKLVYNQWVPMGHRIKFEFRDLPLP